MKVHIMLRRYGDAIHPRQWRSVSTFTSSKPKPILCGEPSPPLAVNQHHRRLDLALRYLPIAPEQPLFFSVRNGLKTVLLVKADSPGSISPRADQYRTGGRV